AVSPIRGKIIIIEVISPVDLPYLLLKYSGTVFTSEALNLCDINDNITNAIPIVITYHEALIPHSPKAFSTTPSELPPPISVAARVPAISKGPSLLPATIKSSLDFIFFDDQKPIPSIANK